MKPRAPKPNSRIPIILIVGVLAFLWAMSGVAIYYGFPQWEQRGQFGDMFGCINALFSSLALAGVVAAIFIQKQELELQRDELALTRDELRRTAEAQESSAEFLSKQLEQQTLASVAMGMSALLASLDQQIGHLKADIHHDDGSNRRGIGGAKHTLGELRAQRAGHIAAMEALLSRMGNHDEMGLAQGSTARPPSSLRPQSTDGDSTIPT